MYVCLYQLPYGKRVRLTVGLLLGGRAFAVAGETPEPPLVSLGLLRVEQPRFGGICARVIRAAPGTYPAL